MGNTWKSLTPKYLLHFRIIFLLQWDMITRIRSWSKLVKLAVDKGRCKNLKRWNQIVEQTNGDVFWWGFGSLTEENAWLCTDEPQTKVHLSLEKVPVRARGLRNRLFLDPGSIAVLVCSSSLDFFHLLSINLILLMWPWPLFLTISQCAMYLVADKTFVSVMPMILADPDLCLFNYTSQNYR